MPIAATSTLSLAERFKEMFGSKPLIFRAPERVNLIGEHTDNAISSTIQILLRQPLFRSCGSIPA